MLMKRKHGTPPDWLRTVGRPIRGDYPPFPFRRSAFAAFQNEKKRSRRRFRAPTWQRRSVLAGSLTERRWRQGVENARVYTHTHTHTHTHKKRRKTRKKRTLSLIDRRSFSARNPNQVQRPVGAHFFLNFPLSFFFVLFCDVLSSTGRPLFFFLRFVVSLTFWRRQLWGSTFFFFFFVFFFIMSRGGVRSPDGFKVSPFF